MWIRPKGFQFSNIFLLPAIFNFRHCTVLIKSLFSKRKASLGYTSDLRFLEGEDIEQSAYIVHQYNIIKYNCIFFISNNTGIVHGLN